MTQEQRVITTGQSATTSIKVDIAMALHTWLATQASVYGLQWLLLHADEGIVWGEQRGRELALSASAIALNWNSLHKARLFGEHGELFVWRGPQGWQARITEDGKGNAAEWICEQQMLWGNREDQTSTANAGFTPIVEGSQGIVHAPPIGDVIPTNEQRVKLQMRHYLGEDDAGVLRVVGSRLVKLLKLGEE